MQPDASAEPPVSPGPSHPVASGPEQFDAAAGDDRFSVAAAARRLGIASGTLRTWDRRYGIGPSEYTAGRHRRYTPDDIARLEVMQRALVRGVTPADAARYANVARPSPVDARFPDHLISNAASRDDPGHTLVASTRDGGEADAQIAAGGQVPPLSGAGRGVRGLRRAVLALDARSARELLAASIAVSGVQATWDEMVRPVLSAVAQRWADTGTGVEVEHLLSECVIGVFGALAAAAPYPAGARPVLLAGMPGERHTLPMVVLAAALAQRRVPCQPLGADLPTSALVSAIRRTAPVAVVLWSQLAPTADPDALSSLPRIRPRGRTFVAGPGWAGIDLPPRVVRLESLVEAVDAISAAATP